MMQPTRRSRDSSGVVFAVLFAASLTVLSAHSLGLLDGGCAVGIRHAAERHRSADICALLLHARLAIALQSVESAVALPRTLPGPNPLDPAALDRLSLPGLRRALILAGHLNLPQLPDIARRFERTAALNATAGAGEDETPLEPAAREVDEVLRSLYADSSAAAPPEALVIAAADRLGWFGSLVRADHLRRLHHPSADAAAHAIQRECLHSLMALALLFAALPGVLLLGLTLLIIFVARACRGAVAWRGAQAPGWAFETFTLYLAAFAVIVGAERLADARGVAPAFASLAGLAWTFCAPFLLLWARARGADPPSLRAAAGLTRGAGVVREALAGAAGYAAVLPVMIAAAVITSLAAARMGVSMSQGVHPLAPVLMDAPASGHAAFLIVLAIVIAPLTEEIFFRGLFYGWLRSRGGCASSVAVSALVFAVLHPQGLLGAPVLFVLGAAFALLREWRGSLIAPLAAHALLNGVTVSVLLAI